MKQNKRSVKAVALILLFVMLFSMTAFAENGSNSGTVSGLSYTATWNGTTSKVTAGMTAPGARNVDVTMYVYVTVTPSSSATYTLATDPPYVSSVDPGTSTFAAWTPQTGRYVHHANTTYCANNVRAFYKIISAY